MALISCPECKREISDQAKSCPHCGFPIEKIRNPFLKTNVGRTPPPPLPDMLSHKSNPSSSSQKISPSQNSKVRTKLFNLLLWVIILGIPIMIFANIGSETNSNNKIGVKSNISSAKPISEYAYNDYTKDQFPKLYAEWGSKWVQRIAKVEKAAVHKIANSENTCDSIDSAGISTTRSIPKKEIVIYVNCMNGEHFYVSEKQIKENEPLLSQAQKSVDVDEAINRCKQLIRNNEIHPLSIKYGNIDTFKAQGNGNVVVTVLYESKNDLGGELPHKVKCYIPPEGKDEISKIE
ncbi:zinc ribbon domain-containing protein [Acinetobacter baumannii]|nr:zinc ribbon domain-containing protein [Acinetobacter baumannii]MDC4467941.1 zinc ribbon domain-containing protein [Acinetobacter baumannii]MDC5591334.1 zinc ribbon domain-containing protein [Acinetobacter baumannii]MDC5649903.1 zinc ribbon domain-containing protein [Acinetobacter baumannii]MDC5651863.1 zinc ribbon domain-containing protein [Acinetobacter baumannii]